MNDELNLWFSYLLGFFESKQGSVKNSHPALAEFVSRWEKEQEDGKIE